MSKEISLKLSIIKTEDQSEDYLDMLTNNLQNEIREINVVVDKTRGSSLNGDRGDPINIGQLLVEAVLTSATISTLLNLLSRWITRNKQKKIKVQILKASKEGLIGKTIEVTGQGVSKDQTEIIQELVNSLD